MGRLMSPSRPKARAPQVVYYTPPPSAPAPTPDPGPSPSTPPDKTPDQVAAERAENLLRRNRSRLGTVLTSFRGILAQSDLASSRKTLLGE